MRCSLLETSSKKCLTWTSRKAQTLRVLGFWARRGRVSSVELWGAMALCCAEREELKINFCFCELLDLDKDGALNEVELRLLLPISIYGCGLFEP